MPQETPSGRSSGVEHDLAKVGVEGSNPFARSNFKTETNPRLFGMRVRHARGSNPFARSNFRHD
jgi:hypothetical protein